MTGRIGRRVDGTCRNRLKHREKGLCVDCSMKVKKGKIRCNKHLKYNNEKSKKYRKESKEVKQ